MKAPIFIDVHSMNMLRSGCEQQSGCRFEMQSKFDLQNQTQVAETTLELLDALESREAIPQRRLALRLGVALGLTNAMLKRCIRKGLLKAQQAPAKRFAYYLTPKGFREKTRLTSEYLSGSLKFYRNARGQYLDTIEFCHRRQWKRIALYGIGELAEIAAIAGQEIGISFVAVINPKWNKPEYLGVPVVHSLSEIESDVDAVIVSDMVDPQTAFENLSDQLSPERVLTPKVLHVARQRQIDNSEQED